MSETDNPPPVIMLVDDDTELVALLAEYLRAEGFQVDTCHNGQEAVDTLQSPDQYAVIVLDIMMPGLNGLEVLQILRQRMNTPVIMLTGRGDDIDRIIGLEMGADDYLGKPCNPRELLARIRAVLRRAGNHLTTGNIAKETTLTCNEVHLDMAQRTVSINNEMLDLTSAEFNVLQLLMQSAGTAISRESLTRQVLHRELSAYDRSIDVHVSRIRKKIQAMTGTQKDCIKTIRGQGYQFLLQGQG